MYPRSVKWKEVVSKTKIFKQWTYSNWWRRGRRRS